jgi:hypothetical protein
MIWEIAIKIVWFCAAIDAILHLTKDRDKYVNVTPYTFAVDCIILILSSVSIYFINKFP